jgi:hypothetical protein
VHVAGRLALPKEAGQLGDIRRDPPRLCYLGKLNQSPD